MRSMIGKTVAHYRIVEEIGAGGMGIVYKAEDNRLGRTVALKFLPPELTRDEAAKRRFLHEAQAVSSLQHDNICTVHDIGHSEDGRMFLCMDYYRGDTLKGRLAGGPLSVEAAIDITVQVARGLDEAHRWGIVHRDIKPANVMVTTQGVAKILDFGLAKLVGETRETQSGSLLGTVAYMSPEQARGEPLDPRSDIFSLGAMLYELLTGMTPFRADHEAAILHRIQSVAPRPLRDSGVRHAERLEPVLGRMLAKDPGQRMRSARDVIEALTGVASGHRRDARTSPRRLAVAGGLVALLVVVAALAILRPWQHRPGGRDQETRVAIAVLPFQNLSTEERHSYFAGGLHDEVLTQLSKVASLRVISRTSVMGYADTRIPIREIARKLDVENIVEGSVQVVGGRLRVSVQIIDARTDEHLWAERYDRTLDDAFDVQSEVAQQIVAAVGATIHSSERELITRVATSNPEAYQFYLQAREYNRRPGWLRQNLESSRRLFEQALALDPNFALAHAGISEVHGYLYGFGHDPSPARLTKEVEAAQTALRLAPDLPEAHFAMGMAHHYSEDVPKAFAEYQIALKSIPNDAQLHYLIGAVHRQQGRWEEARGAYRRASRLDPLDANLHADLGGNTASFNRRWIEAQEAYDRALAVAPDFHEAKVRRAWMFVKWRGELDSVRAVVEHWHPTARIELLFCERRLDELLSILKNNRGMVFEGQTIYCPATLYEGWVHELRGDPKSARPAFVNALARLDTAIVELPKDSRIHFARGMALAGLGRQDEAIEEARWMEAQPTYRTDTYFGTARAYWHAILLAHSGAADAALSEIERLLQIPSEVTVHDLRLRPLWDPIRDHPRFVALVAKYSDNRETPTPLSKSLGARGGS